MFALICVIVQLVTHPITEAQKAYVTQQDTARTERVEAWLSRPTPISLSPDQRRRVDSVKTSYDREWRRMQDEVKKGGDKMGFTMKALEWSVQLPKSIQKILTPQQRTTFDANYVALEGKQP